tara:strand:- start:998 stop:1420 length:423 start_codon:yes stop_codon:yes gene_type:complete
MITKAIQKAFDIAKERGWEKTFWAFDIHDTMIKPNYKFGDIPTEFFPLAKEVMQEISKRDDICLIMYTCSHPHEIEQYIELFKENGINFDHINKNPEVKSEGYGYYEDKFYFNVLFEDKTGFDATEDWEKVQKVLAENPI